MNTIIQTKLLEESGVKIAENSHLKKRTNVKGVGMFIKEWESAGC